MNDKKCVCGSTKNLIEVSPEKGYKYYLYPSCSEIDKRLQEELAKIGL